MRKTRRPRGRSSRDASGIQAYGSAQIDAPYSEIAKSKLASGYGTRSALPWISGNSMPCSACRRRAVASCCSELSMPTGRAPRRASHAETYAVPQPSSIASLPVRSSGSRWSSASGMSQMPHFSSPRDSRQLRSPFGMYSAAHSSHCARLRRT